MDKIKEEQLEKIRAKIAKDSDLPDYIIRELAYMRWQMLYDEGVVRKIFKVEELK